uniref:Lymphoid-restricted membrane protein-like isoform X1 n=1 Tax=Dermatophagoides pteronyssinus TaxID=6956 RepID=A0A6P6XNF3_DERPT|nr:lymphoid-restricted membrane protein-like isoform X1 [Dermatophagoides pteronyssinus]
MRRKHSLKRISSCDIVDDVQSFGMPLPTINYMMNGNNNNNNNNFEDTKTTSVDCNNNNNSQTTTTNELIQTEIFPSLPDVMLRKLCLLRENTCNIESLSEQEIDTKFHTLSLAFKTDKFTLEQRVQLYRHQRDIAENDAKNELNHLNEYVQELYRLLLGSESKYFYNTSLIQLKELKDMLDKIDMQVQVIKASMMKISSRSELFGSVKQEEKLSTAFDVILLHTENLKRSKERDAKELDDMKRLLANTGHSKYDHQDYNDFDNGGKRSKNRDSRRISSLLMTNQLQNIQVSYQQISRSGSGPSNQNYLRTRRLSVPAAEIRNRPRLLELFNEATARQLKEKDNHSDNDDDDDEQMAAMARRRQISLRQRNRTLTSIDDRKEYASDNDDDDNDNNERKQSSVKQETKSLDKNECKTERRNESTTPTNSCDDSDHADDNEGNNNHCFDHDSHSSSNNEEKLSCNNSINKCNKLKIQSFYQKLVKKLIPFEDRTWRRKMIEKIQEFYCLLCMLVFTIRSIASSITESSKLKFRKLRRQTNSYDNLRFTISAIFIFVAAMILTFSVIVPMIS